MFNIKKIERKFVLNESFCASQFSINIFTHGKTCPENSEYPDTLTIKCYTHHDIFDVVISIACFYVTTIINGMKGEDNPCSNICIIYPKSGLLYSLSCIAYRPFIGI